MRSASRDLIRQLAEGIPRRRIKNLFGKTHSYYDLEDPNTRNSALSDPTGFINHIQTPAIIDEIQYVPQLLSHIKVSVDKTKKTGQWLLTGSQHFALMKGVNQSLAGRAATATLPPLSIAEIAGRGISSMPFTKLINPSERMPSARKLSLTTLILRGSYPAVVANPKIDRNIWYGSYINTYLERDVRNLEQVGDLTSFEIFLRACAIRSGQILDLTSISREVGISSVTAKRWLSILQTGYQIILLYPYHRNLGKRLIKRPKIFITDTGLLTYLLDINDSDALRHHSQYGAIFETFIVIDFWKRFLFHNQLPPLYFFQTRDGLKIDLVIETEGKLHLIEVKSSATVNQNHAGHLTKVIKETNIPIGSASIISTSPNSYPLGNNIINYSWINLLPRPEIIITVKVVESFQNLSYIGELRQRWEEIKKLQSGQFAGV